MSDGIDSMNYDEFGLFHENAEEFGIPWNGPPTVRREAVVVDDAGRRVSALVWGTRAPELVLVHGGAQNAHTWDTVALALGRPLLAVDMPGHGHSDWRANGLISASDNAVDVAIAIRALAPEARMVVGMSLGGLTSIALADHAPELVRKLVLVDVTPGVTPEKSAPIREFIAGPPTFDCFDEILARTIEHNPTRSVASMRRGVLHNACRRDDGKWVWRYQRAPQMDRPDVPIDHTDLWDALGRITVPVGFARGLRKGTVVTDDDVAELRRRQPSVVIEDFPDAGHSIQGDSPIELAAFFERFLGD